MLFFLLFPPERGGALPFEDDGGGGGGDSHRPAANVAIPKDPNAAAPIPNAIALFPNDDDDDLFNFSFVPLVMDLL